MSKKALSGDFRPFTVVVFKLLFIYYFNAFELEVV
jgi:hypothetical protein